MPSYWVFSKMFGPLQFTNEPPNLKAFPIGTFVHATNVPYLDAAWYKIDYISRKGLSPGLVPIAVLALPKEVRLQALLLKLPI